MQITAVHSLIYLLIAQIFIGHLLHTKHCTKHGGYGGVNKIKFMPS